MIKALVVIIICAAVYFIGNAIYQKWKDYEPPEIQPKFTREYTTTLEDEPDTTSRAPNSGASRSSAASSPGTAPPPSDVPGENLPGLPPSLEAGLAQAKSAGAQELKFWLMHHRKDVDDPRLADIELDYVVLVARENIVEARKVFARVSKRIDSSSPVYPRMKELQKTFQ